MGTILSSVYGQTSILFYAPGGGATGSTGSCEAVRGEATITTGTDNLGYLLIQLALDPSTVLNFCGVRIGPGGRGGGTLFTAASDTIATIALRALLVATVYLTALLVVSWYAFRRSQIVESA